MGKFYTGIGTRLSGLPKAIELEMELLARSLASKGYTLRSGAADGSDEAFERGCAIEDGDSEIFLPWDSFRRQSRRTNINYYVPSEAKMKIARDYWIDSGIIEHFDDMSDSSKNFHGRNYYQVTGKTGQPSEFVLYYAPIDLKGEPMGGTRSAVMRARDLGIPTYNLGNRDEAKEFYKNWRK